MSPTAPRGQSQDSQRIGLIGQASEFNIGLYSGKTAGRTVMHAHAQLNRRQSFDVVRSWCGVRGVNSGEASYTHAALER